MLFFAYEFAVFGYSQNMWQALILVVPIAGVAVICAIIATKGYSIDIG